MCSFWRGLRREAFLAGLSAIAGLSLISFSTGKATAKDNDAGHGQVNLFDGIKSGALDVKFIPHNSREGQLLVTNKTDRPLTVQLPDAFAAVPVLAQQAAANPTPNGTHKSYNNNNNNQNQALGGGMGGVGGGGIGGFGGGAFDVAPEKVAKLKLDTVCLEHGKKEPNAHLPYAIQPIESYTTDTNVQELCKLLGSGQISQRSAQAAAWHLANHMTWEQLMNKKIHHLTGGDQAYFNSAEIAAAIQITDRAMKAAEARPSHSASGYGAVSAASAEGNSAAARP